MQTINHIILHGVYLILNIDETISADGYIQTMKLLKNPSSTFSSSSTAIINTNTNANTSSTSGAGWQKGELKGKARPANSLRKVENFTSPIAENIFSDLTPNSTLTHKAYAKYIGPASTSSTSNFISRNEQEAVMFGRR